jgi:hypothetical protein
MIDMNKYKLSTHTLVGRLREFIKAEVGPQPFTAAQLVRAVVDNDPKLAKRAVGSVRDGVNRVVREMLDNGELDVISGGARSRVYVLKQGGEE